MNHEDIQEAARAICGRAKREDRAVRFTFERKGRKLRLVRAVMLSAGGTADLAGEVAAADNKA